jgi:hypothetical protein
VTVFCATNEIAFPMSGDGAILDLCGPFPDGDGIYDLPARVFIDTRVLRSGECGAWIAVPQHQATVSLTPPCDILFVGLANRVRNISRSLKILFLKRNIENLSAIQEKSG